MKQLQIYPIVFATSYSVGQVTRFCFADSEVEVSAPHALINELIRTCDGEKTQNEVLDILSRKWDKTTLQKMLSELRRKNIICDGTSLSNHIWPFVKNPTRLFREPSKQKINRMVLRAHKRHKLEEYDIIYQVKPFPLGKLIQSRKSIRQFSSQMVKAETLVQFLWAAYGLKGGRGRTVPSAGALYPLKLSIGLLKPNDKLRVGIYHVYLGESNRVGFKLIGNDVSLLINSLVDPLTSLGAQGIVIISGAFQISEEKYGNRSLLYVPIEAGHAAQNIHLAAVENGVGTVEVGGFSEESLRVSLGLPKNYWPLTTLIFGYPSKAGYRTTKLQKLNTEIKWATPIAGQYKLPFAMAFIRIGKKKRNEYACGRDSNSYMAATKACAEAEEWKACGVIPKNLTEASWEDLNYAVDPREIVSYHKLQYLRKKFPLKPFDTKIKYLWKEGSDIISSRKVFILADHIYFPYNPPTPRYTYANSSGTAAHTDIGKAIEHATLELIERDSFLITWLNHLKMPRIILKSLPQNIQNRIFELTRTGFRVTIKDLTLDLAPVIMVFAQHRDLHFTTCACCSSFGLTEALDRALKEVEAAVYCRMQNGHPDPIKPSNIFHPLDHGALYGQGKYFHMADFLVAGGQVKKFGEAERGICGTWTELIDRLTMNGMPLIVAELRKRKSQDRIKALHIVKVFVPGLVPLNFGYGTEPCGMKRIYDIPIRMGYRLTTLPYGKLTKFPHPYT